jgi:hypothetical protein
MEAFSEEYVRGWNDRGRDLIRSGLWDGRGEPTLRHNPIESMVCEQAVKCLELLEPLRVEGEPNTLLALTEKAMRLIERPNVDEWLRENLPRFCQTAGGISTPQGGEPTMMAPLTYVNVRAMLEAYLTP